MTCQLGFAILVNVFDTAVADLEAASGADTRTLTLVTTWNLGAFFFVDAKLMCRADGVPPGSVTFSDAEIVTAHLNEAWTPSR